MKYFRYWGKINKPFIFLCLDSSLVVMDDIEFKSEPFQRVFQYLRHYSNGSNLDSFCFNKYQVEGPVEDCLKMILQYVI